MGDVGSNDEAYHMIAGAPGDTAYPVTRTSTLIRIVAVLAIGLLASNIDNFLVIATHPRIASEFSALEDSSWIFVSFLLARAATQVLYAKLSKVCGRVYVLAFCYALFGLGCGQSRSIWHVVLGRILSGSGGFGIQSLVLVLITDLIPSRDVASWLGYINVVSTTGRSLGGPLGGLFADQVGWRWSSLGQVPFFFVAIIASLMVIPNTKASKLGGTESIVSRLDLPGSLLLGSTILFIMLPFDIGGQKVLWTHPAVYSLFSIGILPFGLFVVNETHWAEEPVVPLRLLRDKDIIVSYVVICCITAAQVSMLYTIPIYFQVTAGVSNTTCGLHLLPSVVGNTIGGLFAGIFVKRTGDYKTPMLASSFLASMGILLIIIRWSGHTNCCFANGVGWSVVVVSMNAVAPPAHRSVIIAGSQLVTPIAQLLGLTASSSVMSNVLRTSLDQRLRSMELNDETQIAIIQNATTVVEYTQQISGEIAEQVVASYVIALKASLGVILAMSSLGLLAGMFLRQRKLGSEKRCKHRES
ncbi:MFS general substrate transporter [Xylariaceae sp. FL1272]|nr:MFS general substrate transporter [Xylariaceae sp. FL1272]